MKRILAYAFLAVGLMLCGREASAQNFMEYEITAAGDTIFYDSLKPARHWDRMAKGKGRDWRQFTKLVRNFGKVYPYAIEANRLVDKADADLPSMTKREREKYVSALQKDIMDKYEPILWTLSYSQVKLLIKLISRETGMTPYDIMLYYKSRMTAGFWEGIAKMFGGSIKLAYNGAGKDKPIEDLIKIWNDGDYETFYWSVFGEYPQIAQVPTQGRQGSFHK